MLVEDLMTTEIVTCGFEASVQIAAKRMLKHGVGSVIVVRDGDPFGIVTETDILQGGAATNRPFDEIAIEEIVSHPLITTTGDTTIRSAVNRMIENDIKKLPVVESLELRGILTRTDIVAHYGDFIKEAHSLDQQRDRWEARRQDIDEF